MVGGRTSAYVEAELEKNNSWNMLAGSHFLVFKSPSKVCTLNQTPEERNRI